MNSLWTYLSDVEQGKRKRPWAYAAGIVVFGLLTWTAFLVSDGKLAEDSYSEVGKTAAVVLCWCFGIAAAGFVFLFIAAAVGEHYRQKDKPINEAWLSAFGERLGTFGPDPKKEVETP